MIDLTKYSLPKFAIVVFLLISTANVFSAPVWIDVRSEREYQVDHIQGDIHFPHEQAAAKISELFPDKTTEIVLYCRSGRRAGIVLNALEKAGYQNIRNAGGINEAQEERGIIK